MGNLIHKFFSLPEGDILFIAHCDRDNDWGIEIKIETKSYSGGWAEDNIDCPWMVKAMVEHITDDMALASILDDEYDFVDNFSDTQMLSIMDMHDIMHKQAEERELYKKSKK